MGPRLLGRALVRCGLIGKGPLEALAPAQPLPGIPIRRAPVLSPRRHVVSFRVARVAVLEENKWNPSSPCWTAASAQGSPEQGSHHTEFLLSLPNPARVLAPAMHQQHMHRRYP